MRTVENIRIDYGNNITITLKEDYEKNASWTSVAEKETKKWFTENIKNDWVVFDVGANVGMYCSLFSKLSSKVYAFEPTDTINILKRNMQQLNTKNVYFFEYAVSNKDGNHLDSLHKIWDHTTLNQNFDFITVDTFIEKNDIDKLDLIKIDTDGYDFEVLQGCKNTLEKFCPKIIVELNNRALGMRGQTPQQAIDFMKNNKYSLVKIFDGENYFFEKTGDNS